MTSIDTDGKMHEQLYPKPPWLQRSLDRAREERRSLYVEDFPLHSYTGSLLVYPNGKSPIVDGDTVDVLQVLREGEPSGLGRMTVAERIRLLGYNAPEVRGVPDPGPGLEAAKALGYLLQNQTLYLVTYYDRRSFNRILAWCYASGSGDALVDVAEVMIAGDYGTRA